MTINGVGKFAQYTAGQLISTNYNLTRSYCCAGEVICGLAVAEANTDKGIKQMREEGDKFLGVARNNRVKSALTTPSEGYGIGSAVGITEIGVVAVLVSNDVRNGEQAYVDLVNHNHKGYFTNIKLGNAEIRGKFRSNTNAYCLAELELFR